VRCLRPFYSSRNKEVTMVRNFVILAATWGVCLSAMLPALPAAAADKGKRWQTAKSSSSNGNGSSNGSVNGFSTPSFSKKLSTTPRQLNLGSSNTSSSSNWKKLQGMNALGGNTSGGASSSNAGGLQLGKQYSGRLKVKQTPSFGGLANGIQNGGTLPNGGIAQNGQNIGNLGNSRNTLPAFDRNKIADILKNGKIQPIQPDFGLGGLGGGLDDNGPPGNGNQAGDAADPGQGDNGQADPNPGDGNNGGGNGNNGDPHDDDCHDHPFPWWPPIIIGGGGGHHHCPPSANITVIEQPILLPQVQNVPATVDLQLLDVRFVDAGDPALNLGPRYRLTFGNAGTVPAGNFRVLAMASHDGTPNPAAPFGTAEVMTLAAGEVAMADVRLSLSADLSSMGALIVVVDSAVQIAETDEQNNVAVLDRTKIAVADMTTAATP
jgi:hypothetical protein